MKKVIGMDIGDKHHFVVAFEADGTEQESVQIVNTKKSLETYFSKHPKAVVVMEASTHSGWISRLLEGGGHEVYVGNPRKLRAIWDADDKSDERDARMLGMLYRLEPRLLHPIHHRSEETQNNLAIIKARNILVQTRVALIGHVRCIVKGSGERLPTCGTSVFVKKVKALLPAELNQALQPVLNSIEAMSCEIYELDHQIEELCKSQYQETKSLLTVPGVGPLTALTYVLTLETPHRFLKSRDVGPFLGLTPRRDQSGDCDKQLGITKAGNGELRRLLVNCSQHIMGPFGADTDLRRYGERIAARGGKNAKKRAIIAVSRKLAVTLHRLWVTQEEYIELRGNNKKKVA